MSMKTRVFAVIIAAVVMSGCSVKKMATRAVGDVMKDLSSALYHQKDPEFARDASASFLLFTDALLEGNPDDEKLLLSAVQGNTAYAMAFYSDQAPQRAFLFCDKARDYGFQLLNIRLNTDIDPMQNIEVWDRILAGCTKVDVPALYWTGSAWAGWITTHPDSMLALADLSAVLAIMDRVKALDESYQDGGVHLFYGLYYASQPRLVGGDPEKAGAHFQTAMRYSGEEALMPKVLYARYYALKIFDQELFEKTLQDVINAPPALDPDLNLMNAIARQRAQRLLDSVDDFF